LIKPTFESQANIIFNEITKRKGRWTLFAISYMDWDDVRMIIFNHIYKKWHLYNHERSLLPWVNKVINSQMINLIRDKYGNYSLICLKCRAYDGNGGCDIYGKICDSCPLFAKWKKTKESAFNIKLPVTIENHVQEVYEKPYENSIDIQRSSDAFHLEIKKHLTLLQYKIYKYLYMENKTDAETAKLMGYKSSEKGRMAGYASIAKVKKIILQKGREIVYEGFVDIVH